MMYKYNSLVTYQGFYYVRQFLDDSVLPGDQGLVSCRTPSSNSVPWALSFKSHSGLVFSQNQWLFKYFMWNIETFDAKDWECLYLKIAYSTATVHVTFSRDPLWRIMHTAKYDEIKNVILTSGFPVISLFWILVFAKPLVSNISWVDSSHGCLWYDSKCLAQIYRCHHGVQKFGVTVCFLKYFGTF